MDVRAPGLSAVNNDITIHQKSSWNLFLRALFTQCSTWNINKTGKSSEQFTLFFYFLISQFQCNVPRGTRVKAYILSPLYRSKKLPWVLKNFPYSPSYCYLGWVYLLKTSAIITASSSNFSTNYPLQMYTELHQEHLVICTGNSKPTMKLRLH